MGRPLLWRRRGKAVGPEVGGALHGQDREQDWA